MHHWGHWQPQGHRPDRVQPVVNDDFDGYALYDLDEITRGIFRGKGREPRAGAVLDALYVAVQFPARIGIDFDIDSITRLHAANLRLLEIGGHPYFRCDDHEHDLARRQVTAELHVALGDEPV